MILDLEWKTSLEHQQRSQQRMKLLDTHLTFSQDSMMEQVRQSLMYLNQTLLFKVTLSFFYLSLFYLN